SVIVLQAAKLALHRRTPTIQLPPPLRLARDQRSQPGRLDPDRVGRALAGGAAPLGGAPLVVRARERPLTRPPAPPLRRLSPAPRFVKPSSESGGTHYAAGRAGDAR